MTIDTSPRPAARPAPRARPARGSAWAKHVLVFLHVLTSLGWWAMGLAQISFMMVALGRAGEDRLGALEAAQHLDHTMLIYFANAAAYTGIMLAALTQWGFFRYWWVTVKFTVTIAATVVGIMLLGQWRQEMIDATRSGGQGPSTLLVMNSVTATVAALAFLTWVSIAKPWGRIRPGAGRAPQRTQARAYLLACAPPFLDYAVSLALGFPSPLLQLLTVLVYPARRASSPHSPRRLGSAAWRHRWQARLHWSPERPEERDEG